MFEVLVYMFENYIEADIRPDQRTLARELFAAGFDQEDINGAFDWFSALEEMTARVEADSQGVSIRIYADMELQKLSAESLSFMMFLEQANVLSPAQRELVMDRAMALPQPEVGIDETHWIVLMSLWNQGKANDYLFVEDAVFGEAPLQLH